MTGDLLPSNAVALVFAELPASAATTAKSDPAGEEAASLVRKLVVRMVRIHGGSVAEDAAGWLLAFREVGDALHWCMDVQRLLLQLPWPKALDTDPPDPLWRGLALKMVVHVDKPRIRSNVRTGRVRYFGEGVELGRRVLALTAPGQVLLTANAWELVHPLLGEGLVWEPIGVFAVGEGSEALVQVGPEELAGRAFPAPAGERLGELDRATLEKESFARALSMWGGLADSEGEA